MGNSTYPSDQTGRRYLLRTQEQYSLSATQILCDAPPEVYRVFSEAQGHLTPYDLGAPTGMAKGDGLMLSLSVCNARLSVGEWFCWTTQRLTAADVAKNLIIDLTALKALMFSGSRYDQLEREFIP